jgi:hypothetical protein
MERAARPVKREIDLERAPPRRRAARSPDDSLMSDAPCPIVPALAIQGDESRQPAYRHFAAGTPMILRRGDR